MAQEAKLVDASGSHRTRRTCANGIRRRAVIAIRAGKPYFEEIVGNGPGRKLYAADPAGRNQEMQGRVPAV